MLSDANTVEVIGAWLGEGTEQAFKSIDAALAYRPRGKTTIRRSEVQ